MTALEGATLPITLADTAAPVKMWLPQEETEDAALEQLRNIADEHALHLIVDQGSGLLQPDPVLPDDPAIETEILAASIRSPNHVKQAAMIGADVATIPAAVIKSLVNHPLTDKGIAQFVADWKKTGQSIA